MSTGSSRAYHRLHRAAPRCTASKPQTFSALLSTSLRFSASLLLLFPPSHSPLCPPLSATTTPTRPDRDTKSPGRPWTPGRASGAMAARMTGLRGHGCHSKTQQSPAVVTARVTVPLVPPPRWGTRCAMVSQPPHKRVDDAVQK